MATTGTYWNLDNPLKPWGPLDPDDLKHIPWDFSDFLNGESTTYADHNIEDNAFLQLDTVGVSNGVVLVAVSVKDGATVATGTKYPATVQVIAADGQKLSQTLYFKIGDL
jgi:hypothetical protein